MDNLERLEESFSHIGLKIDYKRHRLNDGYYREYSDGFKYLSVAPDLSRAKMTCVAYHEAGHYQTMIGYRQDSKNEARADRWAVHQLVPICKLIMVLNLGAANTFEAADLLGVTEDFINKSLNLYSSIHGLYTIHGDWVISFQPKLMAFNYKTEQHLPE